MLKKFEQLNALMLSLDFGDKSHLPANLKGLSEFFIGGLALNVMYADLLVAYANANKEEALLVLSHMWDTMVCHFEDSFDDGDPIKYPGIPQQLFILNAAMATFNFAKAWRLFLGLIELLGFEEDEVLAKWKDPAWGERYKFEGEVFVR